MSELKYACNKCKKEVGKKHFTAEDGRILCNECSQGVKPCSERIQKIIDTYKNK